MLRVSCFIIGLFVFFGLGAQSKFPQRLSLAAFNIKTKNDSVKSYSMSTPEKKVFLFFNIKTEAWAEVMYNGAKFVFDSDKAKIFPIYFAGQLTKKTSKNFASDIPTQIYSMPYNSVFKDFNLTEADFPLIIVYDEKNEFCGFTRRTEDISELLCDGSNLRSRFLKLKILTEEKNKTHEPYANKPVFILSGTTYDTIAKLTTDKYGDFNTQLPDLNQDYIINVKEKKKNSKFVVLASQTGRKIGKFKATSRGFEFRLLQVELTSFTSLDEPEDEEVQFKQIKPKETVNFIITENLYYESGQAELSIASRRILDKIKQVLDLYPEFKLLVISHTDSQGNDEANMELSLKRSEKGVNYLVSKGIAKERLMAEGKGETEIRNRCLNDVDCSDKEHEYNRRTEFKFSKR
jgi:outer membrane protein OmpA-like peptidoglycan-associated protein